MGKYLTPLREEQQGKWNHKLLDVLSFDDDVIGKVHVPPGFVTDYASIRILHNVFLFVLFALVAGYGNLAATVHDYLYTQGSYSRKECDAVLYRALRAEHIAKWRCWLFWAGVRVGGASHFTKKQATQQ